ncbi:glycine betaine ABC transporter substrate-binding protein [Gaiella sp.]|uniref:ABC transporter substrate-binding protein n=1 Tax=Gaiella sp. TaxID=2663207 RepID=UPI002E35F5CA|nr:glycine betaine ABC transporter substrate-binding protein [Gaiella sp.]HEX5584272.1 glycine betaine ABC transporter substrate-binding protein [Gaiella sp.]
MIRKHNRRAAKAAFSIALGVALVLGLAAAAPAADTQAAGAKATPIIVGTKNFPEQYILGQLYKQALEAQGFDVQYKENIASTELIDTSLRSGKITMYPEYTGIMLSVTFKRKTLPKSAAATYKLAKKLYDKRGQTLLRQTPFQDVDVLAVTKATAKKYGLKTIRDLRKVPNLDIAGFPEWETRWRGEIGTRYGVKGFDFVPLAGISAYTLLDQKKVVAADVFTTDPQLLSKKYVQLRDPQNMFGFQHVAPVVDKKLVSEYGAKFTSTINKVTKLLTVKAIAAMNRAVGINKKDPEDVAAAFLKANRLT